MSDFINLDQVIIGDRLRALDEAKVKEYAESIAHFGLLHPIVLRKDNTLIAGGHRLAAHFALRDCKFEFDFTYDPVKFVNVPFQYFEDYLVSVGKIQEGEVISDAKLKLLEVEENVKRHSMHWSEQINGIATYHKLKAKEARNDGEDWHQSVTGKLLGVSQASVSLALKLASAIQKNPSLANFGSANEALKSLSSVRVDELQKEFIRRQENAAKKVQATVAEAQPEMRTMSPEELQIASGFSSLDELGDLTPLNKAEGSSSAVPITVAQSMFFHGSCLDVLPQMAKATTIHHIITDLPYGYDLADTVGTSAKISRTAKEHEVDYVSELMKDFIPLAYEVCEPSAFMCMWYDLQFHQFLVDLATKAGWLVCRWPFVWCKSSPCKNQAAGQNFTKSTEFCMILRKSPKAVLIEKQLNNYIVAPNIRSATHPFVKPEPVWQRLISAVSTEQQTIVDPFAGEGSMLSAALKLNRKALGIEINNDHIASGVTRIHNELNS